MATARMFEVPFGPAFKADDPSNSIDLAKCRLVDRTKVLSINLPPGKLAGFQFGDLAMSVWGDLMGAKPPLLRVAVYDGKKWVVGMAYVHADNWGQQRLPLGLPAPATPTAFGVAIGRVDDGSGDDTLNTPLSVLIEINSR